MKWLDLSNALFYEKFCSLIDGFCLMDYLIDKLSESGSVKGSNYTELHCSKEDILVYATKLIKAEMPISLRLMG
jgi:hypothetical protein